MRWKFKALTLEQQKVRLRNRVLGMIRYAPLQEREYRDAFHEFLNQLGGLAGKW